MRYLTRTILLSVCLAVFSFVPFVAAQNKAPLLNPNRPVTFSLSPDEEKSFTLQLKKDGIADITWLANDSLILAFGILNSSGKALEVGDSSDSDSALFIAPDDGEYTFVIKFDKSSEIKEAQNVSLEYRNTFKLPIRSKQKDFRQINGYDVKIISAPTADDETGESIVVIEKAGRIKKVIRAGGGADYIGFSFPDTLIGVKSSQGKRNAALIRNLLDKTGDGIPDVMIDYFSGGAHCCFSTYFINLGESVELVEMVNTEHAGLAVIAKNPKGGLRFETNENTFAYWNIHFAGSPLPPVILEFVNGELRPNFILMKKPPPTLAALKTKARAARLKISSEPYTEVGMEFEEAFWSEMLDLIYTGNETLAWQYFDLVWPVQKRGKDIFLNDFKQQLAESYYVTRNINSSNSFRNFMRLFEKNLQKAQ